MAKLKTEPIPLKRHRFRHQTKKSNEMKTLTIMSCCCFIGVMMSCEKQHHKESSKTPENTDNSVISIKEAPKEVAKINRFLDPNKYHETYVMHIVRDLRTHEAGGRSVYLPERGSALKVNGNTIMHTKYHS